MSGKKIKMCGKEKENMLMNNFWTHNKALRRRWEHTMNSGHTVPRLTGCLISCTRLVWIRLLMAPDWRAAAAVLEYSVTVNSFIESEALTPLQAEHPRLKSTQSSAAFAVCHCVSQKERRQHMLLSWPQIQSVHSCVFVLCHSYN